jgi:hypothetical protein
MGAETMPGVVYENDEAKCVSSLGIYLISSASEQRRDILVCDCPLELAEGLEEVKYYGLGRHTSELGIYAIKK